MSLRLRLALAASLVALVGLGLGLFLSALLLSRLALAEVDQTLRLQANLLLESALAEPDRLVPPEMEAEALGGEFPGVAWLYVDGELRWEGGLGSAPDLLRTYTETRPATLSGWRVYAQARGEYRVVVAQPLGVVDRLSALFLRLSLPIWLGLGVLTGILAYFLVGQALWPLRRLAQGAERFTVVDPPPGNDEVARLARSFARLLAALKAEREREVRFLALASHELKTPIAAFRVGLETLLRAREVNRETLGRLKLQAERLEALAENLLALSRAQAQDLRWEEVDLVVLAGEVFDRFQPLAVARGREILLETEPVLVQADPRLLERALNNLVHNALLHGQGTVRLRVGVEGGRPFVEVGDEGQGPPPGRAEGLGMRVVRQVADALGAEILLRRERGFAVQLRFRTASGSSASIGPGADAPEVRG
ncbi:HAMP domain-containing sensor histidine kinase [Thermus hydrothermalis]|uniref:HAMP domain-containing sensor histidine kinase n=1 Tax=Thermus hydrothermalis TaxID=2908148 RepID=UPI001FAB2749|nr:HAMP domain-containing sensor histidine kinase [Thermus hydrothermalis]